MYIGVKELVGGPSCLIMFLVRVQISLLRKKTRKNATQVIHDVWGPEWLSCRQCGSLYFSLVVVQAVSLIYSVFPCRPNFENVSLKFGLQVQILMVWRYRINWQESVVVAVTRQCCHPFTFIILFLQFIHFRWWMNPFTAVWYIFLYLLILFLVQQSPIFILDRNCKICLLFLSLL